MRLNLRSRYRSCCLWRHFLTAVKVTCQPSPVTSFNPSQSNPWQRINPGTSPSTRRPSAQIHLERRRRSRRSSGRPSSASSPMQYARAHYAQKAKQQFNQTLVEDKLPEGSGPTKATPACGHQAHARQAPRRAAPSKRFEMQTCGVCKRLCLCL